MGSSTDTSTNNASPTNAPAMNVSTSNDSLVNVSASNDTTPDASPTDSSTTNAGSVLFTVAPPLEPSLGDVLVNIFVGEKRKKFVIHRKLIRGSSDYFKNAFSDSEEARKGEMYMPQDSPGAFSLYVEWLYRSAIPRGHSQIFVHDLYEFYILADKLGLLDLKDMVMDCIQDIARDYDLLDVMAEPKLVQRVFEACLHGGGLPEFCARMTAWTYVLRAEREDDNWITILKDDDMETFLRLAKKNSAIFSSVQRNVIFYVQVTEEGFKTNDPRLRNEKDLFDRCFFHCHAGDYNCRASQAAKDKPEFVHSVSKA